jgi:hypothetical protein
MKRWVAVLVLGLTAAQIGRAQDNVLVVAISSEKHEYRNTPLRVPLSVPKEWANFDEVAVEIDNGDETTRGVGQLTPPGITTESIRPTKEGLVRRDLHVVLPQMAPAKFGRLRVRFEPTKQQVTRFAWQEKKGEYQELILTRSGTFVPYLRYMDLPYDTLSPAARDKSYKVFHHLYDPTGKRFVTNGGYTNDNISDPKKLLYPHHRGIMYGFNKCAYGPDLKFQADTWHCPPPPAPNEKKKVPTAHVAHEKTLSAETGPVLGRHRVLLGWYGAAPKPFAMEERELTVYNIKGGTLVEFASRLKPTEGKIRVDGDPQHAGFQFRAANDVAEKTKKLTYYLHPDGSKGDMGKERNWPQDKTMVDLPWYAMSFVLDEQRYTTVYLNHPRNPKESRFSERDYGRFGGYFAQDVTEQQPLVVNYRLWLQPGEMTQQQAEGLRTAFATPPKMLVK